MSEMWAQPAVTASTESSKEKSTILGKEMIKLMLKVGNIPVMGSIPPSLKVRKSTTTFVEHGKPKSERRDTGLLGLLLTQNRQWQEKVREVLIATPPELPEYNDLLERLDKLRDNESGLLRQMARRKGY